MKHVSKWVVYWLYAGIILIFFMTVIGGITRLTHSGLSIVEWSMFSEAPLFPSEAEWNILFDQYKQSPEFKYINADFTLTEFKSIFWWEYIHRMWGRMMGFVFIIPYLIFSFKKMIPSPLHKRLGVVLLLGAFQGFLGWYMVKSGLINEPAVSHIRLASHLLTAFLTCAYIYWIILELTQAPTLKQEPKSVKWLVVILSIIVLAQIKYGAFVAGLKAGFINNTFPDMNGMFFPDVLKQNTLHQLINSPIGVQFTHRLLAYLIILVVLVLYILRKLKNLSPEKTYSWLYRLISVQVLLGIFTLIYRVPLILGLAHQLVAFLVLLCLVNLNFKLHYSTKSLAE